MKILIDLSDNRNVICKKKFIEQGCEVLSLKEDDVHNNCKKLYIFSPSKKFTVNEINKLTDHSVLLCGNITEENERQFFQKNISHINVMKNEEFVIKNANLTTEGVLALLLEKSSSSLFDSKYLILGGGRIAKSLAIMFIKLGCRFSIGTFNAMKYAEYFLYTNEVLLKDNIFDKLSSFDVIINTIPSKIFEEGNIEKIKRGTLFIETASIDCMDRFANKNFEYVLAPALPQKYSLKTAGEIFYKTILEEVDKFGYKI